MMCRCNSPDIKRKKTINTNFLGSLIVGTGVGDIKEDFTGKLIEILINRTPKTDTSTSV